MSVGTEKFQLTGEWQHCIRIDCPKESPYYLKGFESAMCIGCCGEHKLMDLGAIYYM